MNARRGLAALGTGLADLLFPPLCVGCDDRLPALRPPLPLCPACRRTLAFAPADSLSERLQAQAQDAAVIDRCLALWTFDDGGILQRLQHALKYRDRPSLGLALGAEMARAWTAAAHPLPYLVTPVPLARVRLLERGYNQAERLAAGMSAALGVPIEPLLVRARATRSQTRLSRPERRQNVEDAFRLADGSRDLGGRRVLLVDDVLTTGATTIAAARPLHEAGARVDVALLALTRE